MILEDLPCNIPSLNDTFCMDDNGNINNISAGLILFNWIKPIKNVILENIPHFSYNLHEVSIVYLDNNCKNLSISNLALYIVYGQKDNIYITKVYAGNNNVEYTEPRVAIIKNNIVEHIALNVVNAAKYANVDRSTVSHIVHEKGTRHKTAKGYTFKYVTSNLT